MSVLRRRQATSGTENGIFILMSPDIARGENKYNRRLRNRYNSFTLSSVGLLIIIAVYLILLNNQPSSSSTLHAFGNVNFVGNNTAQVKRSSSNISESAAGVTIDSATPPKRRTSYLPKIPRRLIFTYKYNLIAPSAKDPPFDYKDPLTANVLHTVETYHHHWAADDARTKADPKEEVVVSFLSDNDCLKVIAKAEPRLVGLFQSETRGEYKADICRVAELYLHGGYYFDIDIGVVEPLNFDALYLPTMKPDPIYHLKSIRTKIANKPSKDDIVTFSTVYNGQGRIFQAFAASMPRHPVLKRSLDYMVAYYEGTLEQVLPQFLIYYLKTKNNDVIPSRKNPSGMGVGPFTLSIALRSTTDEEWEKYVNNLIMDHGYTSEYKTTLNKIPAKARYARYLYEVSLEDEKIKWWGLFDDMPLQDAEYEKKIKWCNYICFEGHKVYFYSRVPGSKGCPLEKHLSRPKH